MPDLHARMNASGAAILGKIVGCFGIKGYLKIHPYTTSPERFCKLRSVYLGETTSRMVLCHVQDTIVRNRIVLIKFDEIHDRNEAEKVVGNFLFVEDSERPQLPKDLYYIDEIIGCEVWTVKGRRVGIVEDVLKLQAQDVWEVRSGENVYSIPAVKEFIRKIDVGRKKITVSLIEGLLG